MKRIIFYLLPMFLLLIASCSDDSTGTITDPFGGGGLGGGNGSVTFTISSTQDQQGGVTFNATPSVAVKITKVTVALPAQQFTDLLQGDGTTVFQANQPAGLEVYSGVSSGQQWTFQFEGTLSSNNETFNVTSNYTIP